MDQTGILHSRAEGASTCRLYLFGRIDLRDAHGNDVLGLLAQPKRLALTAWLLVAGADQPKRRDTIVALFWPELDQEHARKALNKAVYFIRQALGDDALLSRGTDDLLVNTKRLWCDAGAFTRAAEENRLAQAVDLYRGDLMPGLYVEEAPGFERWLEDERVRFRATAARCAQALAELREREGHQSVAVECARRALELTDMDELSVRRLLGMLDRLGDRAGALRAYQLFERRLRDEYAAMPAAETQALIAQIRERHDVHGAVLSADGASTPVAVTKPAGQSSAKDALTRGARVRRRPVVAAAVVALALGALALALPRFTRRPAPPADVGHRQLTFVGNAGVPRLAPNGAYVAFHTVGENQSLFVQNLSSGRTVKVADSVRALTAWMPNSEKLLISRPARLPTDTVLEGAQWVVHNALDYFLVPRSGGAAQHVAQSDRVAVSRDGGRLAMSAFQRPEQLSILNLQTLRVTDVIPLPDIAMVWDVVWSPSGDHIAMLTSDGPGNPQLHVAVVTVASHRITVLPKSAIAPPPRLVYGASDSVLYVAHGNYGSAMQIVRLNLDLSTMRERGPGKVLLSGFEIRGFDVSWDGRVAIYARNDQESRLNVVTFVNDSGRQPAVRQLREGTFGTTIPTFAPDGRRLAFVERHVGKDIYVMDTTRGVPERLTYIEADEISTLSWSPSGGRIAFIATPRATPQEPVLMITDLASKNTRRLGTATFSRTIAIPNRLAWANDHEILYVPVDSTGPSERRGSDGDALHAFDLEQNSDHVLSDALPGTGTYHVPLIASPGGDKALIGEAPAMFSRATGTFQSAADRMLINLRRWTAFPNKAPRRDVSRVFLWANDGTIYFTIAEERATSLWRARPGRDSREFVSWIPRECRLTSVSAEGTRGACVEVRDRTDIWEMRGFDPDTRR